MVTDKGQMWNTFWRHNSTNHRNRQRKKFEDWLRNVHPYSNKDMYISVTFIITANLQWNYKINLPLEFLYLISHFPWDSKFSISKYFPLSLWFSHWLLFYIIHYPDLPLFYIFLRSLNKQLPSQLELSLDLLVSIDYIEVFSLP